MAERRNWEGRGEGRRLEGFGWMPLRYLTGFTEDLPNSLPNQTLRKTVCVKGLEEDKKSSSALHITCSWRKTFHFLIWQLLVPLEMSQIQSSLCHQMHPSSTYDSLKIQLCSQFHKTLPYFSLVQPLVCVLTTVEDDIETKPSTVFKAKNLSHIPSETIWLLCLSGCFTASSWWWHLKMIFAVFLNVVKSCRSNKWRNVAPELTTILLIKPDAYRMDLIISVRRP